MKKIFTKVKNNLKSVFTSNDKLAILSLSLLIVTVFLSVLSYMTPSKGLQNQRGLMGGFCLFASFYLIPIFNMQKKDKLMYEFGKLIGNLAVGIFACSYWIFSIKYAKVSIGLDIIMSLLFIYVIYYFLYKVYQIAKIFVIFINRLATKIFPNSNSKPNGFKYVFERVTAILISVSGALATVLAIATSIKALIDMFLK